MKAVDYLKEKARMTKYNCSELEREHPEKAVAIVEEWAKENPVKTYLSVLLEKLPNVYVINGLPKSCPYELFNVDNKKCSHRIKCIDCWNREYKEETNES